MNYKELMKDARKAKAVDQLTHTITQWTEEGQQIIGRVIDIQPFTGGKFEGSCNQYLIETDDGIISTLLGGATDKQIVDNDISGKVVCITFNGKKILEDNRQINLFTVEIINNA